MLWMHWKVASADYETFLKQKDFTLDVLQRQIVISRSVELLSRARLFLSQNNYDQSKKDVQAARGLLIKLTAEIPVDEDTVLQSVIDRLDLAVQNLPAFPVIAVDDVDIAWELLVNGAPYQTDYLDNQSYPAQTQVPVEEPTPTETP